MTSRILSCGLLAVTLLAGGAAWAQSPAAGAGGGLKGGEAAPNGAVGSPAANGTTQDQPATRAEPASMQHKKTNPQKNGTTQSESPGGENKNGR